MARAKPIRTLKCEGGASEGARVVLRSRVREMVSLREQALDWSDPEGVHDMRVASRRLRSALRDFRSIFSKRDLELLSKASKTVADHLGSVRDEDVAIIALEKLKRHAAPEAQRGLELLLERRSARREIARQQLAASITVERLAKLQQLFTETLSIRSAANKTADKLDAVDETSVPVSFREFGRERVAKQFRRLSKEAVCIYQPAASTELHELRIEAKRLRYALELFGGCWRGKLNSFADRVAELQGSLGELHDCDEWMSDLARTLTASHPTRPQANENAAEDASAETHLRTACVWLLDHFAKERAKHYRQALATWMEWETTGFAERLRETLDAAAPSGNISAAQNVSAARHGSRATDNGRRKNSRQAAAKRGKASVKSNASAKTSVASTVALRRNSSSRSRDSASRNSAAKGSTPRANSAPAKRALSKQRGGSKK